MYSIDLKQVARWERRNDKWFPTALDINCPYCGRLTCFTCAFDDKYIYDGYKDTASYISRCSGCGKSVSIWAICLASFNNGNDKKKECSAIYIYPPLSTVHHQLSNIDTLPPRVAKVYLSAVSNYNSGIWDGCASLCRKTLEGILVDILEEDKRKGGLAQQLNELSKHPKLSEPLVKLAESVKDGGNIAVHFDSEKETDQATAKLILTFIEYLLEYNYILPRSIDELNEKIK